MSTKTISLSSSLRPTLFKKTSLSFSDAVRVLSMCFVLLSYPEALSAAPPPDVEWVDDFLGSQIDSRYTQSVIGSGHIDVSTFTSGAARLYTFSKGQGSARLRFGEEGGTGQFDVRNWRPSKGIRYEASVFFNTNTNMRATVGFVGRNDPNTVLAAILDNPADNQWFFQARAKVRGIQYEAYIPTGFRHTPGQRVNFMITTSLEATPTASLWINDHLVATAVSPQVPPSDLCAEFQLWNELGQDGWEQATMWVDWLRIRQSR